MMLRWMVGGLKLVIFAQGQTKRQGELFSAKGIFQGKMHQSVIELGHKSCRQGLRSSIQPL